jgi:4'-phosphopantetheinyl transferase
VLHDGEVHVWFAEVSDALVERSAQVLDAEERTRAARFRAPHDRRMATLSRGTRRLVLSEYVAQRPGDLEFVAGPYGKPALRSEHAIAFNVSHAGDLVIIAVTRRGPVGVDVERVDATRDLQGMALVSFSNAEQRALAAVAMPQRSAAFHRTWAQKEAFIKWLGLGLQCPLDGFDVRVDPGYPAALVATRIASSGEMEGVPDQCVLSDLVVPEGYAGALATRGVPSAICVYFVTQSTGAP